MTYMLVAFLVYLIPFLIAAGVLFFVVVAPAMANAAAGSLPMPPPLPALPEGKELHLGLPAPTASH